MDRRREEESEHAEGTDRWLLTYSDMITLLLTLFIVLYSMSNIDLEKFKAMASNLGSAFNNTESQVTVASPTGYEPNPPTITVDAAVDPAVKKPESSGADGSIGGDLQNGLEEVYTELQKYIKQYDLQATIDIEKTDTYVKISLRDRMLFFADSKEMITTSEPILEKIGQVLTGVYDKIDHITISGHTASTSTDTNTSNNIAWELSTNRAVTVLNYLTDKGLPEKKLSIEGYSHFAPVAPNDSEENRTKNRRVEIIITKLTPNVNMNANAGARVNTAPNADMSAN